MKAMVPQIVEECRRTGFISSAFLDSLHIAKADNAKVRDDATCISNMDAFLVTHEDSIERYKEAQLARERATNPVLKELAKREAKAKKLIADEEKKRIKREKKEKEAAEDQAFLDGLSPVELKAEKKRRAEAKKQVAAENKAMKAHRANQKREEAMDLLGVEGVEAVRLAVRQQEESALAPTAAATELSDDEEEEEDRVDGEGHAAEDEDDELDAQGEEEDGADHEQ